MANSKEKNPETSPPKRFKEADPGLFCYIHDVSPVKTGQTSGKQYFNCVLQMEKSARRAVCFKTDKKQQFNSMQIAKSPVKISQHTESKDNTIILGKFSRMKAVQQDDVSFQYDAAVSGKATLSIQQLEKVAAGQIVSVKANVFNVGPVDTIKTKEGSLPKQAVLLRDSTASIKLQLFGDAVESLQDGNHYLLENVRLKVTKKLRYLNSTKTEPFVATTIASFPCISLEAAHVCTEKKIVATIMGVNSISKSYQCIGCNRKTRDTNQSIFTCNHCGLKCRVSACDASFYSRVMLADIHTKDMYELSVPSEINWVFFNCNKTTDEDTLAKAILDCTQSLSVTFDEVDQQISSISLA